MPAPTDGRVRRVDILPFLANGIGFATLYYGDIEPDFDGGIPFGIRGQYLKPGQTQFAADEWGAIAAWAWGLRRVMDYLETEPAIDAKRVALLGSSRLGKTVLWTGATDPRFAVILASVSGESGAAISRRNYGETIKHMTDSTRYDYQFARNYQSYGDRVNQLPFDGHMLDLTHRTASAPAPDGRHRLLVGPEGRVSRRGGGVAGVEAVRHRRPHDGSLSRLRESPC